MSSKGKLIVLAGAPLSTQLNFQDQTKLLSDFEDSIKRFIDGKAKASLVLASTSSSSIPKWRVLCLQPGQDTPLMPFPQTPFLLRNAGGGQEADSQFFQHSLSLIEGVIDERVVACEPSAFETSMLSNTSMISQHDSDMFESNLVDTTNAGVPTRDSDLQNFVVTNLNEIPDAKHLDRIRPQTMTINLIVAIITVLPTRTVHLHKRHIDMDIIELIVGDDTRAGFGISFWLASQPSTRSKASIAKSHLRSQLQNLKAGDIVGLRNIALSVFQQCVYGQSLSRSAANIYTKLIEINHSPMLAAAQVQVKHQSVLKWAEQFIGTARPKSQALCKGTHPQKRKWVEEELPPDTQP